VDDFKNIDAIIGPLDQGPIVVSKAHSEVGVEYLAPFDLASNGVLYIACVQCKFVHSGTNWNKISKTMKVATKGLKKKKVEHSRSAGGKEGLAHKTPPPHKTSLQMACNLSRCRVHNTNV